MFQPGWWRGWADFGVLGLGGPGLGAEQLGDEGKSLLPSLPASACSSVKRPGWEGLVPGNSYSAVGGGVSRVSTEPAGHAGKWGGEPTDAEVPGKLPTLCRVAPQDSFQGLTGWGEQPGKGVGGGRGGLQAGSASLSYLP